LINPESGGQKYQQNIFQNYPQNPLIKLANSPFFAQPPPVAPIFWGIPSRLSLHVNLKHIEC
ncbi:hypothetical protein NL490_27335, partial [Klebsiella pneumoniae]|nr:hypothetical protein [Klebsiella pneumoniae]